MDYLGSSVRLANVSPSRALEKWDKGKRIQIKGHEGFHRNTRGSKKARPWRKEKAATESNRRKPWRKFD